MSIEKLSDQELLNLVNQTATNNSLQSVSDEELLKMVNQSAPKTQQPESFQQANLRRAGEFSRGIPQGLGNVAIGGVQLATDIGEKAAKLIEKIYFGDTMNQQTFGTRLAEQVKQRKEQQSQLPTAEKIGIVAGETAPLLTAGSTAGAKVAKTTGSNIAGLIAGGAVGGAEMSALAPQQQAGLENRISEVVKGGTIGGAIGGTLGVGGKVLQTAGSGVAKLGEDIIKGYKARPVEAVAGFTNKPVETLDAVSSAIKEKSSNLYNQMRESGAILRPQATRQVFNEIDNALKESGILNPRLHGDTIGVLSDLKNLAETKKGNVGLEELDQYRQLLNDVVKKNTDVAGKINSDGLKANIAINKLDDVVENLKPEFLSNGNQSISILKSAREEWKRYRKFDTISNIVRKADGDPNRTKTLMQNFVNNPKNLRGFTEQERSALRNASRNSTGEGLLKAVGKFGFDLGSGRNIGNAALPVGSILVGGGAGSLLATVGTVSRQAQKLSARGKVEDVLKLIEGQKPEVASKVVQKLPPKTRDYILTNLLTKSTQ